MAAAWNDLPATGGLNECAALVSSAEALRVSAPELSVQLARRALMVGATDSSAGTTHLGEGRNLSMRAQALLASGLVRMSQHARAVEPGFAALALAESSGAADVAAEVRIDLAACAQQVGEPLLGGALLRPVLEAAHTPPSVRAMALGRLVGCVAHVARRDDVEDALAEADRLLAADSGISPDVRRMERARLAVRSAGYHRWYGDTEDAVTAAREGLNLLSRSRSDLRSESDRLRARLALELVCGLLDEGEPQEAEAAARPTVDEPVRATSAASVGRLMLALASRVYLPSGQTDRGRHLLDQAAWMAERHALDGLRADTLTEISRLDEQAGRAAEALEAMRAARAAEHRRMRAMSRAARHVLVEVGADHGIRDTTQQSVAAMMRRLAHPAGLPVGRPAQPQVGPAAAKPPQDPQAPPAAAELAGTVDMDDEGTRLLDREALFRRLRSVRKGERPAALTLVRFESNNNGGGKNEDRGPDTGIMAGLADKVRDMAPENAELARSDGGELAVLLPATTKDQAEEFAATIRETAIESDWAGAGGKDMSISTGVVHTDQAPADAAAILTAARDALTPAQATTSADSLADTSAALHSALSEETPTRPLTTAGPTEPTTQTGRSILSSLSIPSGSGGRRRAGEEQPPGAKSRWPAEPTEAPRWTRADRRAQQESTWPTDPTPTPPTGWPVQAEEPSQGKRAATSTRPSFSETHTGAATAAINRTTLPTRHGRQPEPSETQAGQTTRRDLATSLAPAPGTAPANRPTPSSEATPTAPPGTPPSSDLSTSHPSPPPHPAAANADGSKLSDEGRRPAQQPSPASEPAQSAEAAGSSAEAGLPTGPAAPQPGAASEPALGEERARASDEGGRHQGGASSTSGSASNSASAAAASAGRSEEAALPGRRAASTPDSASESAYATTVGGEEPGLRGRRSASDSGSASVSAFGATSGDDGAGAHEESGLRGRRSAPDSGSASASAFGAASGDDGAGAHEESGLRGRRSAPDSGSGGVSAFSAAAVLESAGRAEQAGLPGRRAASAPGSASGSAFGAPSGDEGGEAHEESGLHGRRSAPASGSTGASTFGATAGDEGADASGESELRRRRAASHSDSAGEPVGGGGAEASGESELHGRRAASPSGSAGEAAFSTSADGEGAGHSEQAGLHGRRSASSDSGDESAFSATAGVQSAGHAEQAGLHGRRAASASDVASVSTSGATAGADDAAASEEVGLHARQAASASGSAGESAAGATAGEASEGEGLPGRRAASASGSGGFAFGGGSAGVSEEFGLSARRLFPESGSAGVSPFDATPRAEAADAGAARSDAAEGASAGGSGTPGLSPVGGEGRHTSVDAGVRGAGDGGFSSGGGGMLRASDEDARRSSYEETKAELARMMSVLNAKSLAAREGKRKATPSEPAPAQPAPAQPAPAQPDTAQPDTPEPGQRSGLMAAFDALTGPVPGLRAEFDASAELPARKPAQSWAELRSAAVVESPADDLFGAEAETKPKVRSSLGAAFGEFDETEKKVTEPVKETVQEPTYDEPIGPQPRPEGPPRRGERSSATIASLLTEALAAYQSTAEDAESHRAPERFDSFVSDAADRQQSGVTGRHRSPD